MMTTNGPGYGGPVAPVIVPAPARRVPWPDLATALTFAFLVLIGIKLTSLAPGLPWWVATAPLLVPAAVVVASAALGCVTALLCCLLLCAGYVMADWLEARRGR